MPHRTQQVEAIAHGTVVDHIPSSTTLRVARLLADPEDQVFIGVNLRSGKMGTKGVVKIAGRELTEATISQLALIAPRATMCIIRDYQVVLKQTIPIPDQLIGASSCPNPNCVTNHEPCLTRFRTISRDPFELRCQYCERSFPADEFSKV